MTIGCKLWFLENLSGISVIWESTIADSFYRVSWKISYKNKCYSAKAPCVFNVRSEQADKSLEYFSLRGCAAFEIQEQASHEFHTAPRNRYRWTSPGLLECIKLAEIHYPTWKWTEVSYSMWELCMCSYLKEIIHQQYSLRVTCYNKCTDVSSSAHVKYSMYLPGSSRSSRVHRYSEIVLKLLQMSNTKICR